VRLLKVPDEDTAEAHRGSEDLAVGEQPLHDAAADGPAPEDADDERAAAELGGAASGYFGFGCDGHDIPHYDVDRITVETKNPSSVG
jgi:hypothetical protein